MDLIKRMWPTMLVTAIYMVQIATFLMVRDWRTALIFTGYCIANVGLIASI